MRILTHECRLHEVAARRCWIEDYLKLPIFKEENTELDTHLFYLIIMNEEDLTALSLKYPADTFRMV